MTMQNLNLTSEIYKRVIGPLISRDEGIDPEIVSELSLLILSEISLRRRSPISRKILNTLSRELEFKNQRLQQKFFGCNFRNPLGLAAGFDKNGVAASIWDRFGFGFAEIGTVTYYPQKGNPRPRLFRLAKEQAALNRMGFNNKGAQAMLRSLEKQLLPESKKRPAVLGINLGKSKIISLDKAEEDYFSSLEILSNHSDYAVINVSSPNTPGLRELQEPNYLSKLIKKLKSLHKCPPLFIKIAPDLLNHEIDSIANLACEEGLEGIIAVNTSINRLGLEKRIIQQTGKTLLEESGGLSGMPICNRALEVLKRIRSISASKLILIAVGGIHSPETAWERISAGASLLQIYTGWIYKGPIIVPQILEGINNQLELNGFNNISEAIGSNVPWHE